MKKLAILTLSAAFLVLARSGVSAYGNYDWNNWGDSNDPEIKNEAEISQTIQATSHTGSNSQDDWAEGSMIKFGKVEAGAWGDRLMTTGTALSQVDVENHANINEGVMATSSNGFGPLFMMGSQSSGNSVKNSADIYQSISASAYSGYNTQDDGAKLSKAMFSRVEAGGGDRTMRTGDASSLVFSVNRVNYNLE